MEQQPDRLERADFNLSTQGDFKGAAVDRMSGGTVNVNVYPAGQGVAEPQAAAKTPFVLPQLDVSTFTGRREEMETLERLLLDPEGPKVCSIAGLAGVGGIGKSALACHFATVHEKKFRDGVIGLRVDGKAALAIARDFVQRCGLPLDPEDGRDAATLMQETFAQRQMLLIFDNAEDATVKRLRPGGQCTVIVTTRNRDLSASLDIPEAAALNLSPLPKADALQLLRRILGDKRVDTALKAAQNLIDLVGNLPLGLQIIGTALRRQERRSIDDYADSLHQQKRCLNRLQIPGDPDLNISASLQLSLNLLQPKEIDFLACLSVCAQEGFSRRTATVAADCADEWATQDSLDRLQQLSLLNEADKGEHRFVFHPLVYLFARNLAEERGPIAAATERHARFWIDFVQCSDVTDGAIAAEIATEIDDIVLAARWLQAQESSGRNRHDQRQLMIGLNRAGVVLQRLGRLEEALQIFQQEVEIENVLGDRQSLAIALNCLGGVLQQLGLYQEALEAFQREMEISAELEDKQQLGIALNCLGRLLQQLERYEEALEAFQRQIKITETLEDKQSLAIGLNCLGGLLQQLGRNEEALAAFQREIEIEEALDARRSLAIALNRAGGLLQQMERYEEALAAFQQQIKIAEALEDRRSLAIALNCLGGLLQQMERHEEALAAFQQQIKVIEVLDDKQQLAISLNCLGGLLQQLGRDEEALAAFQQQIEVAEALDDKQSLAIAFICLGRLLKQLGRYEEALDASQRGIEVAETLNDKKQLATARGSRGQLLQQMACDEKALDALRREIEIATTLEDKRRLAIALNCAGGLLQQLGRHEEALAAFQQQIKVTEALGDRQSLAIGLNCLGGLFQQLGRHEEALAAFQRQIEVAETLGDRQSFAIIFNRIGGLLQRLGHNEEALEAFQKQVEIAEALDDQQQLSIALNRVGGLLQQLGQPQEALAIFQRQIEITETLADQQSLAIALNCVGGLLQKLGRCEEALASLQRGIEIAESLDDQRSLAIGLHSLGKVLAQQERWDEAETALRQSYDLCHQLNDLSGQAFVLNSLGQLLAQQPDPNDEKFNLALMYFRESIKLGERLQDADHIAQVRTAMAKATQARGWIEVAARELIRSFEIDEAAGNLPGLRKILPALTQTLVTLDRRQDALTYCQRALVLAPTDKSLQRRRDKLSGKLVLKDGTVKYLYCTPPAHDPADR